ncbi:MAG: outer membrane lipoprotein carrier protein LolA [Paludibacteraceae bacterium]|nr:outer membrane lipoprotein carrier protein LolA [Paludibacteraceae bacterium]
MNKIFSLLLALCISASVSAQKALNAADAAEVEKSIEAQTSKLTTIKSNFKQTKHINGMSKDYVATGDMMYKKDNKVILNYTTPKKYKMVVNGEKVMMENNGKKNVYNTKGAGASMNEMQAMITACMTGNLQSLKNKYKLTYYEDGQNYLVKVVPITGKKIFKDIEMELKKSDKMLTRLRLTETAKAGKSGNDYTEYSFSGTEQNISLADSLFTIE